MKITCVAEEGICAHIGITMGGTHPSAQSNLVYKNKKDYKKFIQNYIMVGVLYSKIICVGVKS